MAAAWALTAMATVEKSRQMWVTLTTQHYQDLVIDGYRECLRTPRFFTPIMSLSRLSSLVEDRSMSYWDLEVRRI